MPWGSQAQPEGRGAGRVRPGTCPNVPTALPTPGAGAAACREHDLTPPPTLQGRLHRAHPTARRLAHGHAPTRAGHTPSSASWWVGSEPTCPHADGDHQAGPTGEPRVDIAGSRDGAPSGARAGESGNRSCPVCIPEGRPRGLGGGRPGGGARTGSRGVPRRGVPRRAGTHSCCCLAPSCQAGSAGGSPRRLLARPPCASGNPLPAGSRSRNAPSPWPRLVWPPGAPPEA